MKPFKHGSKVYKPLQAHTQTCDLIVPWQMCENSLELSAFAIMSHAFPLKLYWHEWQLFQFNTGLGNG